MRALLSAGASTSAADSSFLDMKTPLHKAAAQGHRDVCVALLEAGADPNACDAAGNSAVDVLSLSAPTLFDAEFVSSPRNRGSNSAGGGGTEACSTVILSSGEEKDWGGVREALERYGGRRKVGKAIGIANGDGGDSCATGRNPGSGSSGRREGAAALEQESAPEPSPTPLAWKKAHGAPDVCVEGSEGTTARQTRRLSTEVDPRKPSEVGATAAPASASSKGQLVDTPHSEHGGSAGIPCGECLLPKVVLVRASCCRGLLCKPCLRDISARRHNCRRCRDTRDTSGD